MPDVERSPRGRHHLAVVVAGTVVVGLLQLWWSWPHLHRQITTDESFTYFAVNGGVGDLLGACRSDPAMSLYYSVVFVFAHVTGGSLFTLRLLTFGCYLGCGGLIMNVALRRSRGITGFVGLLLLGGTPIIREAVVDA
ncbi:MAG: hypothetical protein WCC60_09875, partial [Ilumatobacteraceae bacterium]